jgi:hypothetical protein
MSSQQTPILYVGTEVDIHNISQILKSRPYQPANHSVVFATELPMPLVTEFGANIGSDEEEFVSNEHNQTIVIPFRHCKGKHYVSGVRGCHDERCRGEVYCVDECLGCPQLPINKLMKKAANAYKATLIKV